MRRVFGRDRVARRRNTGRRPVAVVAVAKGALDRRDQVRGRLEPERDRVADVQVAHPLPGGLDALSFDDDIADRVAEGD